MGSFVWWPPRGRFWRLKIQLSYEISPAYESNSERITENSSSQMPARCEIPMNRKFLFFTFLFFFFCSIAVAQGEPQKREFNIFAIVKDSQASILEGYVSDQPDEVTVLSKDNQEKNIPLQYIESITLEKYTDAGSSRLDPYQEAKYSVRLRNSQEIYTLQKKYTFSLNTNVGVVTRSISPVINDIISKDLSRNPDQKSGEDKPLIEDKSIIFSLEFKF